MQMKSWKNSNNKLDNHLEIQLISKTNLKETKKFFKKKTMNFQTYHLSITIILKVKKSKISLFLKSVQNPITKHKNQILKTSVFKYNKKSKK